MRIHLIKVTLHAKSAFLVSQPELDDISTDRPQSRDGWGNLYVPGSGIAGNLRDHFRTLEVEEKWMGQAATAESLSASSLWIQGTRLTDAETTVVKQTAIDPMRGAARPKTLRSSEMVLQGATIDVALRLDGEADHGEGGIDDVLVALAGWQPRLGSSISTGLGRFTIKSLKYGCLDLTDRDDLGTWISLSGWDLYEKVCSKNKSPDVHISDSSIAQEFSIREGLHIGGRSEGSDNHLYRRSDDTIVVEGSTLKGLLRSRCAYILRSFDIYCCEGMSKGNGCDCPICQIFGSVSERAKVSVAAAPIEEVTCRWDPHVAIDRITGGAASGRLWRDEVAASGRLKVVVDVLDDDDLELWMISLLNWALKDLGDGYLRIGAKTTRGYGAVDGYVEPLLTVPEIVDQLDPAVSA